MPLYYNLRRKVGEQRSAAAIDGIKALRQQIQTEIPRRSVSDSLLLATWNIRDFGGKKLNPQPRLPESHYYIAEVLNAFDLIAVQEVNENLEDLEEVIRILGSSYDYIVTDVAESDGGNQERMAYIFDRRKISFRKIAGEIVLPNSNLIQGMQFARTPFLCAFQCGWLKFNLNTVHIYYGEDEGAKLQRRVEEISAIGSFLANRAKKSKESFIVLGDFNIIGIGHETMKALEDSGFKIPDELKTKPSNVLKTKHYDQIAFYDESGQIELGSSPNNAGVFDFYKSVFRDSAEYEPLYDESAQKARIKKPKKAAEGQPPNPPIDPNSPEAIEHAKKYFENKWRTWQMSDHLVMWVELKIDFTDQYLDKLKMPPSPQ